MEHYLANYDSQQDPSPTALAKQLIDTIRENERLRAELDESGCSNCREDYLHKHTGEMPGVSTPEQIAAHERRVRQIIKSSKTTSPYDDGDFGKSGTAEPKENLKKIAK